MHPRRRSRYCSSVCRDHRDARAGHEPVVSCCGGSEQLGRQRRLRLARPTAEFDIRQERVLVNERRPDTDSRPSRRDGAQGPSLRRQPPSSAHTYAPTGTVVLDSRGRLRTTPNPSTTRRSTHAWECDHTRPARRGLTGGPQDQVPHTSCIQPPRTRCDGFGRRPVETLEAWLRGGADVMSAIGKPGPSAARPPSTRGAAQGAGGSASGAEQTPTCDGSVAASRRHLDGEFVCRRLGAVTHPGGAPRSGTAGRRGPSYGDPMCPCRPRLTSVTGCA
jgi:hypothetical protein